MKVIIANLKKTEKIAEELAKKILKNKEKRALIIGLEGELGSGKTAFAQFFAKALGIKRKIQSPTFIIIKKHEIRSPKSLPCRQAGETISKSKNPKFKTFVHIDAYRIEKPEEILELGWKELISNPQNIILIEWADNIKKILPKKRIQIKFKVFNDKTRKITI